MNIPKFTAVLAVGMLSACGGPTTPPQAGPPIAMAGSIAISEPRVRLPPQGRDQTAAYMTLTNQGTTTDSLVSATSLGAGRVELHAHITTADNMKAMRQISQIEVPAGATIPLSPGGFHIMFKKLKPGLDVGDALPISLTFASGATAQFALPVVANPNSQDSDKAKANGGGHQH